MTSRYGRVGGREDDEGWRSPAERDLDRILYASAYRRLAGVTQVLPAGEQSHVHNRLTHTLKVEQMARRTAQYLIHHTSDSHITAAGGLDPAVAAAAGAAHDLGHPPFGHIAEDELQHILTPRDDAPGITLPDSFEGNAQTFRIATRLAIRKIDTTRATSQEGDSLGLDLTLATLAAILKYPWCKGEHAARGAPERAEAYYARKWGAYESERSILEAALGAVPVGRLRSVEAEIMDYADDVTYAVHDVEDFFKAGLIPLHEIRTGAIGAASTVFDNFFDFALAEIEAKGELENFDSQKARAAFRKFAGVLPEAPYEDTDVCRIDLHRFISYSVTTFQEGLSINAAGEFSERPDTRALIEILKQLTWYFVIEHPALAATQLGQRRVVRDLVTWISEWVKDNDPERFADQAKRRKTHRRRGRELPSRLLSYLEIAEAEAETISHPYDREQRQLRAIVDFVSGMTEEQAYTVHRRLNGGDPVAVFEGSSR